jgi:hypothetical protein
MTNDMENAVRALVAYGDSVGRSAIDLITHTSCNDPQGDIAAEIVSETYGRTITDSDIDDLTEYMDSDAGDMTNE